MTEAEGEFMADLKKNKILYHCAGAPGACKRCEERKRCQFFSDHVKRLIWASLGRRARIVSETDLPPEKRRNRQHTFIVKVETVKNHVLYMTKAYDLTNWVTRIVDGIIQSIPKTKRLNPSVKGVQKRKYRVHTSEVLD